MMKIKKLGLLPLIIISIIVGIALGNVLPLGAVRVFTTFNALFSQFLGFMVPLIIVGLVTPAIADVGKGAKKLLLITVLLAYCDTVLSGLLSYSVGSWLFPSLINTQDTFEQVKSATAIEPYFTINIPALFDIMSGLVFSFIAGLCITSQRLNNLYGVFSDLSKVVDAVIRNVIIPILPLYIFGIFLNMTYSGEVYHMVLVFAKIIVVIFALHIIILLYQFSIAGAIVKKNPFVLLKNMLPAYFTALGTSSSAASIPVTLQQTINNGVSKGIAGFVVPLCATIHMSGSVMKITACALTICILNGMPHDFMLFFGFILLLSIMMVASPGVPGGSIMAALAPLASVLGFDSEAQALMIALYIAMDSFGTACNVTGDGAIALIVDKVTKDSVEE